jgi:hypothetical protein
MPKKKIPITEPSVLDESPVTRGKKVVNWIVVACLFIIAIGIGIFLRWSFQSEQVLQVNNEPFPIRSVAPVIQGGDVVILNVDFCKNQAVNGQLRISFVSSTREVFLPISNETGEKRCQQTEFPLIVPKDIPNDTYRVKFRATYELNPLKKGIVEEFESKPFKVGP